MNAIDTVKFPLMAAPSSAMARLGAKAMVMAASTNIPKEVRIKFRFETGFRNMGVISVS
jgi:hypothetical protein